MKSVVERPMTRRAMLQLLAAAPAVLGTTCGVLAAEPGQRTRLGVDMNSYAIRWSPSTPAEVRFKNVLELLDHCHQLGAAGVQAPADVWEAEFAARVRAKLDSSRMYLEGHIELPRDGSDLPRFEAVVEAARRANVSVLRAVCLEGRRYETIETAQAWRDFLDRAWRSLTLAEPVVRKHRMRIAIENHKDWRVPELLEVLKRLGSEHVGVCVDIGNSIALLENPMDVVEAYAPHAFTSHLKDMGVQEYQDGFLLSEVPMGEGFLDLPKIIATLQKANSRIHFNLEMITRDPLEIPCLTKRYWSSMEGVSGGRLAETLAMVRANVSKKPLPHVTGLTQDQKIRFEEENVQKSFAFARSHLGL